MRNDIQGPRRPRYRGQLYVRDVGGPTYEMNELGNIVERTQNAVEVTQQYVKRQQAHHAKMRANVNRLAQTNQEIMRNEQMAQQQGDM